MSTYTYTVNAPIGLVARHLPAYLTQPTPGDTFRRSVESFLGFENTRDRTVVRETPTRLLVTTAVPRSDLSMTATYQLRSLSAEQTRIEVDVHGVNQQSAARRFAVKAAVTVMSGELHRWERDFIPFIAQQERMRSGLG